MTEFCLFTSVRYDAALKDVPGSSYKHAGWNYQHASPLYMLDLHRDRILRAASHWQWDAVTAKLAGDQGLAMLARLVEESVGSLQATPLRVTILVSRDGSIELQRAATPPTGLDNLFPRRLPTPGSSTSPGETAVPPRYTLMVDSGLLPSSEFTHFKTTQRDMYNAARQRAGVLPTDLKDVLVVNQHDKTVMEGTITTPYFWRQGRWVTPPVSGVFSLGQGSGGQDGTSRRWALERYAASPSILF
ncbi:hypothetical protein S40293_08314 [Stachybotrys chartarum IBT 40293]|nr:hypothetical protein S40293_08314 [Stachybotrys chartarum IBT 40293]